jgi:hypothetical protein
MDAVLTNKPITSYFKQSPKSDNRLKVTGGELKHHKGFFYLVFGQDFTGNYSIENRDYNHAGGQFQKYTQKVRVFTVKGDLSVDKFNQVDGGYDPDLPYNRRDLNVIDTVGADGTTPDATVYGGVFKAGQVAGHVAPIQIGLGDDTTTKVTVQKGFSQGLSHYTCAAFTIFDAASKSNFTTLFGGISQYHYDKGKNALVLDALDLPKGIDGLPFINTVSTIQRSSGDAGLSFTQTISPSPLPGLLGTNAQFLANSQLTPSQLLPNGVVTLAGLSSRTLVGYIYGGIEAQGPYSALVPTQPATKASNRLFHVFVTPGPSPVTPMPPLPTQPTPYP